MEEHLRIHKKYVELENKLDTLLKKITEENKTMIASEIAAISRELHELNKKHHSILTAQKKY